MVSLPAGRTRNKNKADTRKQKKQNCETEKLKL